MTVRPGLGFTMLKYYVDDSHAGDNDADVIRDIFVAHNVHTRR